ncbi:MAG: hypothetical protein IGS39_08420 [Calothrix sp. C42_A2020_038]|nr:hypothetical protein [Calothrix sp. C42_A2020_038]
MYLFMQAAGAATQEPSFPFASVAVYVIGFIAATTIGSIAWYNSKRPVGWEDKERPSIVPKVEKEETPGIGEPKA